MASVAVIAEVDTQLEQQAADVLSEIGLTTSDLLRLALRSVVREKTLPTSFHLPNADTVAAMKEIDSGDGTRYTTVDDLFAELGV